MNRNENPSNPNPKDKEVKMFNWISFSSLGFNNPRIGTIPNAAAALTSFNLSLETLFFMKYTAAKPIINVVVINETEIPKLMGLGLETSNNVINEQQMNDKYLYLFG